MNIAPDRPIVAAAPLAQRIPSGIAMVTWSAALAALLAVTFLPQLTPTVPGSGIRLFSVPLALFAAVLMLRPVREWWSHALVYLAVASAFAAGSPGPTLGLARVALETAQTLAVATMLRHYFYGRLSDPLMVGLWVFGVLGITAVGASFVALAEALLPGAAAAQAAPVGAAAGWRYWWFGYACSYVTLAGPMATLVALRHRLRALLVGNPSERNRFLGMAAAVLIASLIAFPVVDLSWLGLPPDVILARRLLAPPFALAMAARFRANGAAIALLIFAAVAAVSVTGSAAAANWGGLPALLFPTQSLLLMTTATCLVLGAISWQLQRALNSAVSAHEVKSRFLAMLNHELRTPLNAILGFSELMRLKSMRAIDDAIGPIENIHASGQRLLAMIEGLLAEADRGASAFDLSKEPVELRAALAGAVGEVESQVRALGCMVSLSAREGLAIDADPRALRQMLHVLLSYPLRFVGPGTTIALRAEEVGTDTIVEVDSRGLIGAAADDRDKLEVQLVNALALAHGARLKVVQSSRTARLARLTFFATRAAG